MNNQQKLKLFKAVDGNIYLYAEYLMKYLIATGQIYYETVTNIKNTVISLLNSKGVYNQHTINQILGVLKHRIVDVRAYNIKQLLPV